MTCTDCGGKGHYPSGQACLICLGSGSIKDVPDEGNTRPDKYILITVRGQGDKEGHVQVCFARDDNGMIVGMAYNEDAFFGEDPAQMKRRTFRSHSYALDWVKLQIQVYAGRTDLTFIHEDAEPKIFVPGHRSRRGTQ